MRILAIETSGRVGSLAALVGEAAEARSLHSVDLPTERRTAQTLAPALRDLLAHAKWPPQTVGLVAVAVGPGSFTGLRIGVTTAKALAYATGAAVVAIDTLAAIASQTPADSSPLWAVLDAQREELFAAKFQWNDAGERTVIIPTTVLSQESWLQKLQADDQVTGPALKRLSSRLPDRVAIVPQEFWQPMAPAVGRVAWQMFCKGHRDDVWKLAPAYYRPSAAEEKAARSGL